MAIIKSDVKPVPHWHIGVKGAALQIGIKGIMGTKRLGDRSGDLDDVDLIALHLIAPDHKGLQTLHEGILNSRVNPLFDGDFFVACSWTDTERMDPRSIASCTQSSNHARTVKVNKPWVRPACERRADREILLVISILTNMEDGGTCAIRVLDLPGLSRFSRTVDEVGSL